jgi:putative ubiquitin-RnfH superfamily antitoxin RatB of RatAB toxin-antitoxin module
MEHDSLLLKIELAYALPERQVVIEMEVTPGTTVAQAIEQSGIARYGADIASAPVGIFGERVTRETILRAGDRIEIYRSLTADPKAMRRQRKRR